MKHRTINETRQVASVLPLKTLRTMHCSERLERWADFLERHPDALHPLHGTELGSPARRAALRGDHSPLALAFADPILRTHGLVGDSYGDAHRFFGITHATLHEIVCYCHYVTMSIPPDVACVRVRRAVGRARRIERLAKVFGSWGMRAAMLLSRFFV